MAGPAWLADSFAALMLLTALYCAARLVLARTRRRPTERDVDLVHVLMGVAMAGLLAPRVLLLAGAAGRRALGRHLGPGLRRGHGVVRGADRAVLPGHRPRGRWAATTCRT